MTGFEPATPTSLTWCANRTALHPEKSSANLENITYITNKFEVIFSMADSSSQSRFLSKNSFSNFLNLPIFIVYGIVQRFPVL